MNRAVLLVNVLAMGLCVFGRQLETAGVAGDLPRLEDASPDRCCLDAECPKETPEHVRWCGFNLLGMFCQTKQAQGDARITGCFPEDRFQWMREWGFNFARLPLDYRYFVEKGNWMKPVEAQLEKPYFSATLNRLSPSRTCGVFLRNAIVEFRTGSCRLISSRTCADGILRRDAAR